MKSVAANAFNGCTGLCDVWFEGTASDKANVSIASTGNSTFANATWHYEACVNRPGSDKNHDFDNGCDFLCNYCDFTREVLNHTYDNEKDISCNECGFLRIVPGDVDENNTVTEDDAIYLLYHVFFVDRYPVPEHHNPDYDKDGDVDIDDVFYLLYHSYFPDRFPIDLEL